MRCWCEKHGKFETDSLGKLLQQQQKHIIWLRKPGIVHFFSAICKKFLWVSDVMSKNECIIPLKCNLYCAEFRVGLNACKNCICLIEAGCIFMLLWTPDTSDRKGLQHKSSLLIYSYQPPGPCVSRSFLSSPTHCWFAWNNILCSIHLQPGLGRGSCWTHHSAQGSDSNSLTSSCTIAKKYIKHQTCPNHLCLC